jgi:hypothetical protein
LQSDVKEVCFKMNDDHVVLNSPNHSLDVFVPVKMDFALCQAEFDASTKVKG